MFTVNLLSNEHQSLEKFKTWIKIIIPIFAGLVRGYFRSLKRTLFVSNG